MDAQAPQATEGRLQSVVSVRSKAGAELFCLFGWRVSGKVWGESDVDLAVLLGSIDLSIVKDTSDRFIDR